MAQSSKSISPLRQRMIDDMTLTARYAHVATKVLTDVQSPLDRLSLPTP